MKEVKQFSKSYIFISALYVVLGIVLLAWPTLSVQMICYGFTVAMIVIGFSYGIMYFTKDNLEGFQQMDLVIGIICLAFGIFYFSESDLFEFGAAICDRDHSAARGNCQNSERL